MVSIDFIHSIMCCSNEILETRFVVKLKGIAAACSSDDLSIDN